MDMGEVFINRKSLKMSENLIKSLNSMPSFTFLKLSSAQGQFWAPGLTFVTPLNSRESPAQLKIIESNNFHFSQIFF